MRAPPYRFYNKLVVFVPGYYDEASVSVKKSATSDRGSSSGTVEENLHRSPSESNPDMEWDSEGGVEYAKFTTTLVNLPTEKVNPAGFISKLKKFTL